MLINHSFYIKSSGHSDNQSSIGRYVATVFSKLKTNYQQSLSSGFLHRAVENYKQNPLLVTAVVGFSVMSLILVVLVYALAGGKTSEHNRLMNESGEFLLSDQYTQARIKYQLNVIALSLIEGNGWNKQNVVDFTYGWNTLDAVEKAELKQSVWFQLLENTLRRKASSSTKDNSGKLLADLSATLGLSFSAQESAIAERNEPSTRNPAPVAKAEVPPSPAPQAPSVSASIAEVELQNPQSQTLTSQNANTSTVALQSARDPEAPANIGSQASGSQPTVLQPTVSQSMPLQQNQQQIASASSNTDKPNRVNRVIRTDSPADTQSATVTTAANQNKAASATQATVKPAASNQVASKSNSISESELQKITAEFVNSYEKGNIITFASLFAAKAVSNDETDLNAIRKEYANLFATTSDRRMIIGDLKWDFANNTAIGEGKMEVAVKSIGANNAQIYSGKIQIVVEKQADDVQITKLFHALQ